MRLLRSALRALMARGGDMPERGTHVHAGVQPCRVQCQKSTVALLVSSSVPLSFGVQILQRNEFAKHRVARYLPVRPAAVAADDGAIGFLSCSSVHQLPGPCATPLLPFGAGRSHCQSGTLRDRALAEDVT